MPKTKPHLKVYHLIARSPYGLRIQMLAGLITYLLFAIYCHENYNEKVSIKRVRELCIMIENEIRDSEKVPPDGIYCNKQYCSELYAKT